VVKPWDKDKALRMKQLVEAVPRWHARRRWGYDKRGTGHRKGNDGALAFSHLANRGDIHEQVEE